MTGPERARRVVRGDLAAVAVDHDVVVFDPDASRTHVLAGGAVHVWVELVDGGVDGLVDRVAASAALAPASVAHDVRRVVETFDELGLLASQRDSPPADGSTRLEVVEGSRVRRVEPPAT